MPRPAIVLLMLMALWRTAHVSQVHFDNQTLPQIVASSGLIVIATPVPDSVAVAANAAIPRASWDMCYRIERVLRSPGVDVGPILRVLSFSARTNNMMSSIMAHGGPIPSPIVPGYRALAYPKAEGPRILFFSFHDQATGVWYETAAAAAESLESLDAVQAAIDSLKASKAPQVSK